MAMRVLNCARQVLWILVIASWHASRIKVYLLQLLPHMCSISWDMVATKALKFVITREVVRPPLKFYLLNRKLSLCLSINIPLSVTTYAMPWSQISAARPSNRALMKVSSYVMNYYTMGHGADMNLCRRRFTTSSPLPKQSVYMCIIAWRRVILYL